MGVLVPVGQLSWKRDGGGERRPAAYKCVRMCVCQVRGGAPCILRRAHGTTANLEGRCNRCISRVHALCSTSLRTAFRADNPCTIARNRSFRTFIYFWEPSFVSNLDKEPEVLIILPITVSVISSIQVYCLLWLLGKKKTQGFGKNSYEFVSTIIFFPIFSSAELSFIRYFYCTRFYVWTVGFDYQIKI